MSNLSDLMPAGASGKTIEATATATIASKAPVILNSAGTVSPLVEGSAALGSETVYSTGNVGRQGSAFDVNAGQILITYQEGGAGDYGYCVVGTVSGTTITFGTPLAFNSSATNSTKCAYDANAQKIVIAYQNGYIGTAIVATLSGTGASATASFGTPAIYGTPASIYHSDIVYDSTAQKVVIGFKDQNNSNYGTAIVGTVAGTGISFGAYAVYASVTATHNRLCYDSTNNKTVIAYRNETSGNVGTAVVGTVSGTGISFGTPVAFTTHALMTYGLANTYDTANQKAVISYADGDSSDNGKSIVGTVSGTSISFGTAVTFFSGETGANISSAYDTQASSVVITYENETGSNGEIIVGTVSGTSISFNTAVVINAGAGTVDTTTVYDSTAKKIVSAYKDAGVSNDGYAIVSQTPYANLTAANFVGIADAAITSDATFVVTVGGGKFVIDGVSQDTVSLQEGATYTFDQAAGTNSTHPLRFSTTSDGTHGGGSEYTTGVTTNGTPGSAGAYTRIVVADSAPTLYYYCSNHSGMGGTANTPAFSATGTVVVQGGTVIEFGGIAAATGGTITTDGDYKVHTFTSSGTFEVTSVTNNPTFDILQIAGGGGGGRRRGGGGGAGGYLYETGVSISAGLYGVTVGAGGTGAPSGSGSSTNGGDSSIDSLLAVSVGGGGGGGDSHGASGGSGGGGQGMTAGINAGTATSGQGNAGIAGSNLSYGGGGGGSGGAGSTKDGGAGTANSITGSPVTRAGGGGAWDAGAAGSGGASAGGTGTSAASNATANTGSGGGGGGDDAAGGDGGSGVVIVRYKFQGDQGSFSTGSKYYVQNDGTITTVSSSVNAGLALSTTSLLLNGDS